MACRAQPRDPGSRPAATRVGAHSAAVAAARCHRGERPRGGGPWERRARGPASARSPELTWRLAAASRAACGRGPGRAGRRGARAEPPPAARPPARLALHPPAAPRPGRAASAGSAGPAAAAAARRGSGVGEGGRGRRRLLLHDCLPGCIVGV